MYMDPCLLTCIDLNVTYFSQNVNSVFEIRLNCGWTEDTVTQNVPVFLFFVCLLLCNL